MPSFADTSRVQLRKVVESTFATIPVVGNPDNVRITGESLDFSQQYDSSKEIRADRMSSDPAIVGASAAGGFSFEMCYAEYDKFLEAALQSTWAAYGTNGIGTTF